MQQNLQKFDAKCAKNCKWDVFLQSPHLVLHVSLLQLLLVEEPAQLGKLLPEKLHLRTTGNLEVERPRRSKGGAAKEKIGFSGKQCKNSTVPNK